MSRNDRVDFNDVMFLLNSLNAQEGYYRQVSRVLPDDEATQEKLELLRHTQEVLAQLYGEVEAYRPKDEPESKYCTQCDLELKWGDFGYNQYMCWNCFENKVNILISFLRGRDTVPFSYLEYADIVQYLLETTAEVHRKGRFEDDQEPRR